MARKRGPAPPGHARTHADLSAASPRAAGPAPSCREAPGGGRKGARLRGAARGLKHQVRSGYLRLVTQLPKLCWGTDTPPTEAVMQPRSREHPEWVDGNPGARPPPPRAPPGALGPSHSPTVRSPAPPSLVAPIPPPLPPGHAEPCAVSRATATSHCCRGPPVWRHHQQGPLPRTRGQEIVKAQWPRFVTPAASVPHPDRNPTRCQVNADTTSLPIHFPH